MSIKKSFVLALSSLLLSASGVLAQTTTLTVSQSISVTPGLSHGAMRKPTMTGKPLMSPRPTGSHSCLALQSVVENRANNVTKLTNNMIEKFSAITTRVDEFYKNKVLTKGKTVVNYSSKAMQVEENKKTVLSSLEKAKADIASFDCASNPKGTMTTFRTDMLKVISDLKVYKKSIRDLIVQVHQATPLEVSITSTMTVSPKKSLSPSVTITPTP